MTPESAIGSLDRALASIGETIKLRRSNSPTPLDVEIRAVVRGWTPRDQEGFAAEGETAVIISPSEMEGRRWCWPPVAGDAVVTRGFERLVRAVNPVRLAGVLVRLELVLIGDDRGR